MKVRKVRRMKDDVKEYTEDEWIAEGEALFGKSLRDWLFVCPMCKHVQNGLEFEARTDLSRTEIEKVLGFSCVGRYLTTQEPKKPQGKGSFPIKMKGGGCDWTLGGLFTMNKIVVINSKGEATPMFEFYKGKKRTKRENEQKSPGTKGTKRENGEKR